MDKTSVYLGREEIARLARLARAARTSQAEIIRRAIRAYEPVRQGDRDFALIGVADGPGGSIADMSNDQLMRGFGE
ncbi:MAG: ribbon-helix-helix protein, CopG family [Chloroflexota bacterium]